MPKTAAREIPAEELAQRLDSGEHIQLLDVRSPASVARGHIAFGIGLDFHALPAAQVEHLRRAGAQIDAEPLTLTDTLPSPAFNIAGITFNSGALVSVSVSASCRYCRAASTVKSPRMRRTLSTAVSAFRNSRSFGTDAAGSAVI